MYDEENANRLTSKKRKRKRKRRSETVVEHNHPNHGNLSQSDSEDDLKEGEEMKHCAICSKRRKREESVRVGAVEDDEEIDEQGCQLGIIDARSGIF